jgi:hypothetical protein
MDIIFFFKSLSHITRSQRLSLNQGQVVNILFLCLTSWFPFFSYPPAPVNYALIPIKHNLQLWIELIFLLTKIHFVLIKTYVFIYFPSHLLNS